MTWSVLLNSNNYWFRSCTANQINYLWFHSSFLTETWVELKGKIALTGIMFFQRSCVLILRLFFRTGRQHWGGVWRMLLAGWASSYKMCLRWELRERGKIKIPLWPAVNLRLLTAQRSCCVTGFLMTLQQPLPQIALTWFISPFTTPSSPPPPTHCCSSFFSSQHRQSSIQSLSPSPSIFIDTYTVCTRDSISSSAPRQWQGTSVSRSPCHTVLESG